MGAGAEEGPDVGVAEPSLLVRGWDASVKQGDLDRFHPPRTSFSSFMHPGVSGEGWRWREEPGEQVQGAHRTRSSTQRGRESWARDKAWRATVGRGGPGNVALGRDAKAGLDLRGDGTATMQQRPEKTGSQDTQKDALQPAQGPPAGE